MLSSVLRARPRYPTSTPFLLHPQYRSYARKRDLIEQPSEPGLVLWKGPPPTKSEQSEQGPTDTDPTPEQLKRRVKVDPNHGLYAFFRYVEQDEVRDTEGKLLLKAVSTYTTIEKPIHESALQSGRAWQASELRLKSFQDLHTLWWVLAREKNLLATQWEQGRRLGIREDKNRRDLPKVHMVRKSMARIKAVIQERRLAFEGAAKLVEQELEEKKEQIEDQRVLAFQRSLWKKNRAAKLKVSREMAKQRAELKKKKAIEAKELAREEAIQKAREAKAAELAAKAASKTGKRKNQVPLVGDARPGLLASAALFGESPSSHNGSQPRS